MKTQTTLIVVMIISAAVGFADGRQPLNYTFVEAEYAIDSSVQIYGASSDSDNAFAFGGSWQISKHFVLWGRFNSTSYDLPGFGEHLNLDFGTIGALYRLPIRKDDDSPLDLLGGLSLEHQNTDIATQIGGDNFSDPGLGLRIGVKAGIGKHFDVAAYLHYYDYGMFREGFRNYLDGIFFELGAELYVTGGLSLIGTYVTGEIDYQYLPGMERPEEVEVDRDEIRLGVRYNFR